jgi:transcriptional regulator with XRE-family HTH domain
MLDKNASTEIIQWMETRRNRLSDQLRRAIDNSGMTRYEIAKRTGIDESALAKFYNHRRGLSLKALDRLGECLGLEIIVRRKPRKKGR